MEAEIDERLTFLEESRHSHYTIVQIMAEPGITLLGLFAFTVLKRSVSLVYGFTSLIRARNFICAVPLIRIQIDNLLRFHAASLVDDIDQFVLTVWQGTPIRRIRDRDGQRMTDAYLQEKLSAIYPWIEDMYERTSGYVHLSESHFANTIRTAGEDSIQTYIGPIDQFVSPEVYSEATETMVRVTHALLQYFAHTL